MFDFFRGNGSCRRCYNKCRKWRTTFLTHLFEKKMYQPEFEIEANDQIFLTRYSQWKKENNYIDFADIILLFIK